MKVGTFFYGIGGNSVLIVNRGIIYGLRDAGVLHRDHTPPLINGKIDWEGTGKMREQVKSDLDVAVCQASVTLEVMQRLKKVSPKTMIVLQRDSTHCQSWNDLMHAEMDRYGVKWETQYDGSLMGREKAEYRLADKITVLSRWVESTFVEHGLEDKVIYVGPQTFDREKWSKAPLPSGREFRVLFAGSTGLRKGLFHLLEAWKRLCLKDARLLIAGGPEPSSEKLKWEIRKRVADTPMVTLLNYVPMTKMQEMYANCHVFCIPSVEEGASMTVLEAMAVGRPVVATTHVGADILRHGKNGFLVEPGEWESLADALAWYYNERDELQLHAEEASRSVEDCALHIFGRRYANKIEEAYKEFKKQ